MAYISPNLPTKVAVRKALAAGQTVTVYDPAGMHSVPTDGTVAVEGPHYPKPHAWYGVVTVKDGRVIKIK